MPDPSTAELVFLGAAALAAGAVNAIAGGGSLLSFPALLAVGYPSVAANVTNLVALVPGYAAGSIAYRRELAGQGRRIRALGLTSAIGAAAGTAILLVGPASAFEAVVPFLILLACGLLAAQPALARAVSRTRGGAGWLHLSVFAATVYGGYFGAGLGIMLLAALGAFLDDDLQRLNALKGTLGLTVAVVAAVSVAIFGPVAWGPALVMGATSLIGGWLGAKLAQRLAAEVLRWAIVAFGAVLALVLLLG